MPEPSALPRFPASPSALPQMRAAVAAACESGAVARPVRLRVELVVEELVSNTLNHGYRGSAEGKGIWMDVCLDGQGLRLRYQDEGPPFN
ncbi:MAG: ATP-binding protein, partial [Rhodocyclaceae bacterium]|nr:ATP-binding protein [Rhodocyclaceae bacterium]